MPFSNGPQGLLPDPGSSAGRRLFRRLGLSTLPLHYVRGRNLNRLRRKAISFVATALLGAGISTFAAAPAHADIHRGLGARCQAFYAAYVCGYVNIDDPWNNVRAYGSTEDTSTMNVYLRQTVCIEEWRLLTDSRAIIYCGGQATGYERAASHSALEANCLDDEWYRAYVFWAWDPPNGAEVTGTFYSNWVAGGPYGCP